jgi:hypothetical protein
VLPEMRLIFDITRQSPDIYRLEFKTLDPEVVLAWQTYHLHDRQKTFPVSFTLDQSVVDALKQEDIQS